MIEPGDVFLGKNRWGTYAEYQQLVANGEIVPKNTIQHFGGGSLDFSKEPSRIQQQSYIGAAGARQEGLELPTLNVMHNDELEAAMTNAEDVDHLPLPSMATK